jgi:hypothetical protein
VSEFASSGHFTYTAHTHTHTHTCTYIGGRVWLCVVGVGIVVVRGLYVVWWCLLQRGDCGHTNTCTHTLKHVYICTRIHAHIHTYKYAHTHTYTHLCGLHFGLNLAALVSIVSQTLELVPLANVSLVHGGWLEAILGQEVPVVCVCIEKYLKIHKTHNMSSWYTHTHTHIHTLHTIVPSTAPLS